MVEILATPTSLKIGDHEVPLEMVVEFILGSYGKRWGPIEFYHQRASELAKERGIEFDEEKLISNGTYYFFVKKGDKFNIETTPKILRSEVVAEIPNYVKFLRIVPKVEKDWVPNVLKPVKERINALGLEGLGAIVSKRPSDSVRAPVGPIPMDIELALVADYRIRVEY